MKRILFVDDEPEVLDGLEAVLYPHSSEWNLDFATSGQQALSLLNQGDFDVIVTDMAMPGMDGSTLLERVSELHPNLVRMILSGRTDLESTYGMRPVAHQFFTKPCEAETLVDALHRACRLQSLVNDTMLGRLIGRIGELPARPKIYSKLARMLEDERTSFGEVAALVEQDIGISTKLLQVANTAFFSRGRSIGSVHQAVTRLGANFVKNVALAVEVFRDLGGAKITGFSIEELHDHSFRTAGIAQCLLTNRQQAEEAYLAATLHDVGKLVLVTALSTAERSDPSEDSGSDRSLHLCREELVQMTHAEVGAYLLGLWGLPNAVIEAVANHHEPRRANNGHFDVVAAVYAANILAHEAEDGEIRDDLDLEYLERLGVADQVEEWRQVATMVHEAA